MRKKKRGRPEVHFEWFSDAQEVMKHLEGKTIKDKFFDETFTFKTSRDSYVVGSYPSHFEVIDIKDDEPMS